MIILRDIKDIPEYRGRPIKIGEFYRPPIDEKPHKFYEYNKELSSKVNGYRKGPKNPYLDYLLGDCQELSDVNIKGLPFENMKMGKFIIYEDKDKKIFIHNKLHNKLSSIEVCNRAEINKIKQTDLGELLFFTNDETKLTHYYFEDSDDEVRIDTIYSELPLEEILPDIYLSSSEDDNHYLLYNVISKNSLEIQNDEIMVLDNKLLLARTIEEGNFKDIIYKIIDKYNLECVNIYSELQQKMLLGENFPLTSEEEKELIENKVVKYLKMLNETTSIERKKILEKK